MPLHSIYGQRQSGKMVGFISKCLAKYRLVPSCIRLCGKHMCMSPLERIWISESAADPVELAVRTEIFAAAQQTSSGTGSFKRAAENAFLWPDQGLSAKVRSRTWTNPRTNSSVQEMRHSAQLLVIGRERQFPRNASCAWLTLVCPDTVFVSFFDRNEDAPCSWQGTPANC
jgi:hypothetical protein